MHWQEIQMKSDASDSDDASSPWSGRAVWVSKENGEKQAPPRFEVNFCWWKGSSSNHIRRTAILVLNRDCVAQAKRGCVFSDGRAQPGSRFNEAYVGSTGGFGRDEPMFPGPNGGCMRNRIGLAARSLLLPYHRDWEISVGRNLSGVSSASALQRLAHTLFILAEIAESASI